MTMKLRAAKLKAAFLMAVAAVLILMPAPGAAQAQTSDVWSATLTVGAAGTVKGYLASGTFGSLSPGATFTYDGVDYSIIRVGVVDSNRDLQLILNKAIPDSLKSSHALQVDTRQFALADATLSTANAVANSAATWSNSGLTWSAGGTVTLSLRPLTPVTLSGLTINNATTGTGSDRPAYFANSFRPDEERYLVNVHRQVTSVTVTPTATAASGVTIKVKLGESGTEQTVASGSASTAMTINPNDDLSTPHKIFVTVTDSNVATNTKTYTISVYQFDTVTFTTETVANRVYTVGVPAPNDAGPLPAITNHDFLEVSHDLSNLPAGLHLVEGRRRAYIGGTPTATTSPVTVYFTTTAPELGSNATLTFQVEVVSAPVFDASDVYESNDADDPGSYKQFKPSPFRYTIGQTSPFSVTLPAATGGTGTLTYQLLQGVGAGGVTLASVDKINFDSATRVLSIGVGTDAPTVAGSYGVRWVVTDENGATATIHGGLVVANKPTLPAIEDQSYTVGDTVSFALPKGSSEHGEYSLDYEVTPELSRWAYWPDLYWSGYTLSGTAKYTGEIPVTYTATDSNGVSSDPRTFTVTISSGSNAPPNAPASLKVDVDAREQEGKVIGTATLEWDVLPNREGATGCPTGTYVAGPHVDDCTYYVVQVRDSMDSFPRAHPYVKGRHGPDSFETRDEGQKAYVHVGALDPGNYTARVAGVNQDGAGPWSAEVNFTVPTEPTGGL